jgi:NADPH:quinone reductase
VAPRVDALVPFGRLVAFRAGGGTLGAGSLLGELKSVIGFSIGLVGRTRPDLVTQRRTELWDLLAAGRLNLKYIDLPLREITKAIDLVATRSNLGRVVLRAR